jgi:choline dehydrogenase-like flavoprotein
MIYDYVIVGSGAGGSVAFSHLAGANHTLLLEEGTVTADSLIGLSVSDVNNVAYRNSGIRPALGFPSLAIGEGVAVGGSTEINGGLFWRTPDFVLRKWGEMGFDWARDGSLIPIFENFERRLNVSLEKDLPGHDLDSDKLDLGARRLGWLSVRVPRLTTNCLRKNLCPSGCPSGAKQTASRTLLRDGVALGGEILIGIKDVKIVSKPNFIEVFGINEKGEQKFKTKQIVLSAGAIETPKILVKSKMISRKKVKVAFHANTKVFAEFTEEINSSPSTIFTRQIQEFLEDGILIMGANARPEYFAMAATHLSDESYAKLRRNFAHLGIYTTQSKVRGSVRLGRFLLNRNQLTVRWHSDDKSLIFLSLRHAAAVLFEAGALAVYLPFRNGHRFTNLKSVDDFLDSASFKELQTSTVHLMSSLPMSNSKSNSIDEYGRLKKDRRVQILDASILPTSVAESPQATIMALSKHILCKTT